MAKKKNRSENEIDLTTFAWINAGEVSEKGVPGCGGCHPGGGGLEFDRDGQRYDRRAAADPLLADSLDGDYHDSRWAETGVIEADCFICHLPGYDYKARLRQLSMQNFQWAVIAASGIGRVNGAVKDNRSPGVVYNKRLFNEDGQIALDLCSEPPSENCVFCHGKADLLKRGFSWNDRQNHDVHNLHGLNCTCCHPGGPDHNFGKGNENLSTVRDDLDNTMLSCRECHTKGYIGAPLPQHRKIRPNHLEKMSCEACHIPRLGRAAAQGLCVSSGKVATYPKGNARRLGEVEAWKPDFHKNGNGRLEPVNRFAANLFTNQDRDGIHYPLFARELETAYNRVKHLLGTESRPAPLVRTPEQIRIMLSTLKVTLGEERRFHLIRPAYHLGGRRYVLDAGGGLTSEPDQTWVAEETGFNISHNVAPTRLALGTNGCDDCHDRSSHMFESWIAGNGESLGEAGAHTASAGPPLHLLEIYLNTLHAHNRLKWILGPAIFLLIFFVSFLFSGEGMVVSWQRSHLLAAGRGLLTPLRRCTLGMLAFTGYLFFYNHIALLELTFQHLSVAVEFHVVTGVIFILCILPELTTGWRTKHTGRRLETVLIPALVLSGLSLCCRERFGFALHYGFAVMHASSALIFFSLRLGHWYRQIILWKANPPEA